MFSVFKVRRLILGGLQQIIFYFLGIFYMHQHKLGIGHIPRIAGDGPQLKNLLHQGGRQLHILHLIQCSSRFLLP